MVYGRTAHLEINTDRNCSVIPGVSFTWGPLGLFFLADGPAIEFRWFGKRRKYMGGIGWADRDFRVPYANCIKMDQEVS